MSAHPGFGNVRTSIARNSGVSTKRAGAILAASSRRASPAARNRNPRLNRVKGYKRGGSVRKIPYGTKTYRRDGATVTQANGD